MPFLVTYLTFSVSGDPVEMRGCFKSLTAYDRFAVIEGKRSCYAKTPFAVMETKEISEQESEEIKQNLFGCFAAKGELE